MTYKCTDCILDLIGASGPQFKGALRRECRTQAVPYSVELFDAAISELTAADKIVADISEEDGGIYYDFPVSYYLAKPIAEIPVPPGYTADELDRDSPYNQWMHP